MAVIKLKELYPATQVSSRNAEAWKLVYDAIEEFPNDEKIIVDTEGMLIEDPCSNVDFKKLMTDSRVHILLHNSTVVMNLIKVFCVSCGYSEDRVQNEGVIEQIVIEKPKFDEELVDRFISTHTVEEGNVILDVSKTVSQVGSEMTVKSIIEALKRVSNDTNIKNIILDFNSIHIQDNVLPILHSMLKELSETCVIRVANLPDAQKFNVIKSADEGFNSEIPFKEKVKYFKECMEKDTVGFLAKFKETKKKDLLGRYGDGVPLWSKFAIYRGCKKRGEKLSDGLTVAFDVFNASDFYTKIHQIMEFENENPELPHMRVTMDFDELGIMDKYTGSTYHFNLPIQYRKQDSRNMRVEIMYGGQRVNLFDTVRLPEVAKYVLDDFGIKYNKEKLQEAIDITNKILLAQYSNTEQPEE